MATKARGNSGETKKSAQRRLVLQAIESLVFKNLNNETRLLNGFKVHHILTEAQKIGFKSVAKNPENNIHSILSKWNAEHSNPVLNPIKTLGNGYYTYTPEAILSLKRRNSSQTTPNTSSPIKLDQPPTNEQDFQKQYSEKEVNETLLKILTQVLEASVKFLSSTNGINQGSELVHSLYALKAEVVNTIDIMKSYLTKQRNTVESIIFLGTNGEGKSTIFNLICRLLYPESYATSQSVIETDIKSLQHKAFADLAEFGLLVPEQRKVYQNYKDNHEYFQQIQNNLEDQETKEYKFLQREEMVLKSLQNYCLDGDWQVDRSGAFDSNYFILKQSCNGPTTQYPTFIRFGDAPAILYEYYPSIEETGEVKNIEQLRSDAFIQEKMKRKYELVFPPTIKSPFLDRLFINCVQNSESPKLNKIIKRKIIYLPLSLLHTSELVDMPGANDTSAKRENFIKSIMDQAKTVFLICHKKLEGYSDVKKVLDSQKFLQKLLNDPISYSIHVLINYERNQKYCLRTSQEAVEYMREATDDLEKSCKEFLMENLVDLVSKNSILYENADDIESVLECSISVSTIHPLFFTSGLLAKDKSIITHDYMTKSNGFYLVGLLYRALYGHFYKFLHQFDKLLANVIKSGKNILLSSKVSVPIDETTAESFILTKENIANGLATRFARDFMTAEKQIVEKVYSIYADSLNSYTPLVSFNETEIAKLNILELKEQFKTVFKFNFFEKESKLEKHMKVKKLFRKFFTDQHEKYLESMPSKVKDSDSLAAILDLAASLRIGLLVYELEQANVLGFDTATHYKYIFEQLVQERLVELAEFSSEIEGSHIEEIRNKTKTILLEKAKQTIQRAVETFFALGTHITRSHEFVNAVCNILSQFKGKQIDEVISNDVSLASCRKFLDTVEQVQQNLFTVKRIIETKSRLYMSSLVEIGKSKLDSREILPLCVQATIDYCDESCKLLPSRRKKVKLSDAIDFICCEFCGHWYHVICVGANQNTTTWNCKACDTIARSYQDLQRITGQTTINHEE